jgi:hypothetical protein
MDVEQDRGHPEAHQAEGRGIGECSVFQDLSLFYIFESCRTQEPKPPFSGCDRCFMPCLMRE